MFKLFSVFVINIMNLKIEVTSNHYVLILKNILRVFYVQNDFKRFSEINFEHL